MVLTLAVSGSAFGFGILGGPLISTELGDGAGPGTNDAFLRSSFSAASPGPGFEDAIKGLFACFLTPCFLIGFSN